METGDCGKKVGSTVGQVIFTDFSVSLDFGGKQIAVVTEDLAIGNCRLS